LTHTAWNDTVDAAFRQGLASKRYYVFDDLINIWRLENSPLDHDPALNGCTERRSNFDTTGVRGTLVHKKVGDDSLHYVCLNNLWREASTARVETEGVHCLSNVNVSYADFPRYYVLGVGNSTTRYVCDADTFRALTESEEWARKYGDTPAIRCGSKDNGKLINFPFYSGSIFACRDGFYEWNGLVRYNYKSSNYFPTDSKGNTYDFVSVGTQIWLAQNLYAAEDGSNLYYGHDDPDSIISLRPGY